MMICRNIACFPFAFQVPDDHVNAFISYFCANLILIWRFLL
jgi:hypothetical protein